MDNNVLQPLFKSEILGLMTRIEIVTETLCKNHVALMMLHQF